MILIVEKTITHRAEALREKLFSLGCPCAVCVPSRVKEYRPVGLILTFADQFESVYRDINDAYYTIAIGDGFVNSALNATRVPDDDNAILKAHDYLIKKMCFTEENITPFGVVVPPSLFITDGFVEIYGNMVLLTPTESMILKYLIAASHSFEPISAGTLSVFCSADGKDTDSNRISVHISHINSKCAAHFGSNLIVHSPGGGYFSLVNTHNMKK